MAPADRDVDADEVADRDGTGRQRARRGTGRLDRVEAGAAVAGGDRDDHPGLVEIVDGVHEQVREAHVAALPVRAAEAHVDDVHAVLVGGLERVEDVLAAGVRRRCPGRCCSSRAAPPGATPRDAVADRHAVDGRRRVRRVACDRAGDVRPVRLDGRGVKPRLGALLLNTFATMTLLLVRASGCPAAELARDSRRR